jgi:hypothetical protein
MYHGGQDTVANYKKFKNCKRLLELEDKGLMWRLGPLKRLFLAKLEDHPNMKQYLNEILSFFVSIACNSQQWEADVKLTLWGWKSCGCMCASKRGNSCTSFPLSPPDFFSSVWPSISIVIHMLYKSLGSSTWCFYFWPKSVSQYNLTTDTYMVNIPATQETLSSNLFHSEITAHNLIWSMI